MLPGFRFLFTAIVLSMSILVFGLGAAALLRAAHEEFANLPSRRVLSEPPTFARLNDGPPPTLALLRVDPPVAEKPAENLPAAAVVPETAPDIPPLAGQAPDADLAEPEKLAALTPAEPTQVEPMQVEAAKPEAPAREASAETPPAPAPAAETEAPAAAADTQLAAIVETPEPAAVTPPAPDIYSFEGNAAATRIATLGGPAVVVDEKTAANTTAAKTTDAKPDQSAARKRAAAERARERRQMAARRARLAREAALAQQQLQANPFAQLPVARATR
jgi:hypothetical protein